MKNMNYKKYVACLAIGAISCTLFTNSTLAFNSNTHKGVTQTSLKIISEINDGKYCPLDKDVEKSSLSGKGDEESCLFDKDDEEYWDIVAEYSVKPDEDENQGAYKYHFYNPVTKRNYMGEKTTALSKCVDHFNSAVDYYQKGDKKMAYQELGRAAHFLEDLNTPVHTAYDSPSDSVVKFPLHVRFEKVCDKICSGCLVLIPIECFKYFEVNKLETIAKASSVLSADNFYYLENVQDIKEESLARNAVLNAQFKVTGLMYKFFKQIKT